MKIRCQSRWKLNGNKKIPQFLIIVSIRLLFMKVYLSMKIIQISYNIYKLYKFNEKISGTPKNSEKEMGSLFKNGHF